jgi:DNA-binding transcriptional MerR regulator
MMCGMSEDAYTLPELARLADVTPRTVRYYVQQGLLPAPDPAGPATRYGGGHLIRLRLIRLLQRDHHPLAEIRSRLERMDDRAIEAALRGPASGASDAPASTDQTLAFVRTLMTRAGVAPRFYDAPSTPARTLAREVPDEFPIRDAPSTAPLSPEPDPARGPSPRIAPSPQITVPLLPLRAPATSPDAPPTGPGRSTWERIAVTADVEIHVRRPLDRRTNKQVERLTRIARELFDEEP